MKLLTHRLTNFKGIRDFTLDTQGQNMNIYGENATGKTTLYDAFLWLLFNKDSQNKTDFAIKTLDENGNEIHGLEHAVETVLALNGKSLTLRKVYSEKWTKKRGAAKKEFTGHTTDHFIDGVPVKKGEYDARIANIASEDIFKLLTSPTYFNEHLHWQDRREILLQVCGDISDGDVLDSLATLQNKDQILALTNILNTRSLDDHRKIIQARRTEINKELDKIPVRINEAELAMPDISTINKPEALPKDIALVKESVQKENQKLARLESGGEVAEKTKKLREIEAEIIRLQNEAQRRATGDMFQSPSHRVKHCNYCAFRVPAYAKFVSVPFSSGQALQQQITQNRKALVPKGSSHPNNQSKQPIFPKMAILHKTPLYLRKTADK